MAEVPRIIATPKCPRLTVDYIRALKLKRINLKTYGDPRAKPSVVEIRKSYDQFRAALVERCDEEKTKENLEIVIANGAHNSLPQKALVERCDEEKNKKNLEIIMANGAHNSLPQKDSQKHQKLKMGRAKKPRKVKRQNPRKRRVTIDRSILRKNTAQVTSLDAIKAKLEEISNSVRDIKFSARQGDQELLSTQFTTPHQSRYTSCNNNNITCSAPIPVVVNNRSTVMQFSNAEQVNSETQLLLDEVSFAEKVNSANIIVPPIVEETALLNCGNDSNIIGDFAPPTNGLRHVVIDGSNVAYAHGADHFSVRGLQICIEFFRRRGHKVFAFVPAHRMKERFCDNPPVLRQLVDKKFVYLTPSRRVGSKQITSYDDRIILQAAVKMDAVIISRDQYRDLIKENPAFERVVQKNLLVPLFVEDALIFPKDPLGRNGPFLEEFLKFT